MRILKRWSLETFGKGEDAIKLKLKCLRYKEAPDFLTELSKLSEAALVKDQNENPNLAAYMAVQKQTLPFVESVFERYVKPGEEMQDEDGKAIETGSQILEDAPQWLVQDVLMKLQALCVTGEDEGKGSGSASTSGSAESGAPDTSSPAPSTEHAGGPESSVATPDPTPDASPSVPA